MGNALKVVLTMAAGIVLTAAGGKLIKDASDKMRIR